MSAEGRTLQSCLQSGFEYPHAHFTVACGQFSRASREIASKRMICPAESNAGWSPAGSKSRSGVRPIIGQPPGLSKE